MTKLVMLNVLMLAASANAAVIIEQSGTVDLSTDYHSNLQLLERAEESAYVYTIRPQYKIKALDSRNTWTGLVGLSVQRSSNSRISESREDPFANARWQRELESGLFGITLGYIEGSTRTAQIRETGLVVEDGSETTKTFAADWKYFVTNKLTLDVLGSYERSDFSDTQTLLDSKRKGLKTSLSYKLNEYLIPFVSVAANDFKSSGLERIKYQDYQAGARIMVNPSLDLIASLGTTHVSNNGSEKVTGLAGVNYKQERSRLGLSLARTVFPQDTGRLEVGDRLQANYDYDWSEKNKIGMIVGLDQNDSDYDAQQVTGFYRHEFSPSWLFRLAAGFVNTRQKGDSSASDKSIGITFTYNSPKF